MFDPPSQMDDLSPEERRERMVFLLVYRVNMAALLGAILLLRR
jgi:hypothetical protein